MSRTSPEPATPPASRSWFAISPGFHADDPKPLLYPGPPASKHRAACDDGFHGRSGGILTVMTGFLILSAVLALGGVVVWIVLLLWAAREDGRDQERRDRLRDH